MNTIQEHNTATRLTLPNTPTGFTAYDITREGDAEDTILYKGPKSQGAAQFTCSVIYEGLRRLTDDELLNFCDNSGAVINLNYRSHFGGVVQPHGDNTALVTVYID
jgi:hypothetical protein